MLRRFAISERDGSITTTYPVQSDDTGAEGQREHWLTSSARIRWHSEHAKGFLAIQNTPFNFGPRGSIRDFLIQSACMSNQSWNDVGH